MSPVGSEANEKRRVALVGPGAIGCSVAAALHQAGHPIELCGRRALPSVTVRPKGERPIHIDGPVLTDPTAVTPTAWILLAVKAHQTSAAGAWLARLAGPGSTILVLQNGIEQRELVEPFANGAAIVPSIVWFPAESVAPGQVELRGKLRLIVPADEGGRAVDTLLADTQCVVSFAEDFREQAWYKLAVNAISAFTVLARGRMGIFDRDDIASLTIAYAAEIAAVAAACGVELEDSIGHRALADLRAMPPDLGSSITFDAEAGRELEWESRNGVVQRLGRRYGVPTPVSDVVVPLLATTSAG